MTLNQRAETARKELFVRYDQLNALWLKAEERLNKYHIPRAVMHEYCTYPLDWHEPSHFQVCECLGLQKIKGKWRICHGSYVLCSDPEPDTWTPITECSAEIRVAAVRHLPSLEKAVVESAEKFIPRVDSAIQALSEILGQPINLAELLAERAKLNGKAE